ncbi:MAG: histidine kinase [Thermoanaerobaculia bacterium]
MDFEQRLSREMLKIASWPRGPLQDADALLDHLLAHAGGILEAPRVLLAWEEADEPWLYLAHRSGGGLERSREAPLADPEALEEILRRRFAMARVASWPVRGETVQGRLFAMDFTGESLVLGNVLGEIVAQRIAAELDQFYLTHQLRTAAVTDERVRLACDLHDGMLQSLTGTALQLQALAKWMEKDPPAPPADLREILREIQQLIAADQRDLRFFIEELKPVPHALAGQGDLASRLAELGDRLKRLWVLDVDIHLEGLDGQLSEAFTRQLYRLVRESLFNVARHAEAASVRVEIVWRERALSITVTDDGRGFPFTGRYDHEELQRQKLGPVSLKERIAALGGSMAIDTGPGLTRLEMRLPAQGGAR